MWGSSYIIHDSIIRFERGIPLNSSFHTDRSTTLCAVTIHVQCVHNYVNSLTNAFSGSMAMEFFISPMVVSLRLSGRREGPWDRVLGGSTPSKTGSSMRRVDGDIVMELTGDSTQKYAMELNLQVSKPHVSAMTYYCNDSALAQLCTHSEHCS